MTTLMEGQPLRHVIVYDNTGKPRGGQLDSEGPPPAPSEATRPAAPRTMHTFEFRLSGSEEMQQSIQLQDGPAGDTLSAAAECVRVSVTRSPHASTASIGGVEVHAKVHGEHLVCVARVTDFLADDLVVVQADVLVFREQDLPRQ